MDSEAAILRWLEPDETGARVSRGRAGFSRPRALVVPRARPTTTRPSRFERALTPSPPASPSLPFPRRRAPLARADRPHAHRHPLRGRPRRAPPRPTPRGVRRRRQRQDGDSHARRGQLRHAPRRAWACDSADANPASSSSTSTANSTRSDSSKFSPRASKTPSRARRPRRAPRRRRTRATTRSRMTPTPNPARRFQTLRCHSSLDFLKALHVVERAFERREAKNAEADRGGDEDVGGGDDRGGGNPREGREGETSAPPPPPPPRRLLLVDNVAAFYWLDRASRREQGAPLSLHAVHHASAAKLQELSRRCRAPIIVTKATGGAGGASDAPASARGTPGTGGPRRGAPRFPPAAMDQRRDAACRSGRGTRRAGRRTAAREGRLRGRGGVRGEIRRQVGIAARQTGDAIRGTRR